MKLCLLYGGTSREREVSISSAKSIFQSIKNDFDIDKIDYVGDKESLINKLVNNNITLVINTMHGGEGEDGTIQALLELNIINFTGSGSESSKIAINKHETKRLCSLNDIPTAKWEYFNVKDISINTSFIQDIRNKFALGCVIKPAKEGSSIGMYILENENKMSTENIKDAIIGCSEISNEIIIEKYIKGRELTISVLGEEVLPIIEIIPKKYFYDYQCKYTKGMTEYIVPAKLNSSDLEKKLNFYALKIHQLLNCKDYSRVDFRIDSNNNINLLEINTLPGMTDTSLLPKAALAKGISYNDLIHHIISLAKR